MKKKYFDYKAFEEQRKEKVIARKQELKEAYDRGFSQGYKEGCEDTEEEQKHEEENNWE